LKQGKDKYFINKKMNRILKFCSFSCVLGKLEKEIRKNGIPNNPLEKSKKLFI